MSYCKILLGAFLLGTTGFASADSPSVVAHSGAITLKVSNFGTARTEIPKIAENAGGHVAGGQARVTDKGRSHGWMRLVVPAGQLDATLRQLRTLGSVYGDTVTEHDLTNEVKDLASRAERLGQHEERIEGVLSNGRRLRGSDILFFQDRLLRAGLDQDSLGHQRAQMIASANVSNISVYLFEPGAVKVAPPVPKTFGDKTAYAFGSAWTSFSRFVGALGLLLAGVLVYGLVWAPVAVVLWLVWRRLGPRLRGMGRGPTAG